MKRCKSERSSCAKVERWGTEDKRTEDKRTEDGKRDSAKVQIGAELRWKSGKVN